jgi:hypothetical protein
LDGWLEEEIDIIRSAWFKCLNRKIRGFSGSKLWPAGPDEVCGASIIHIANQVSLLLITNKINLKD